MIYTTLNKIRMANPCTDGWKKLLKHLGKTQADDEPLGFDVIVESNGLDDALWCAQTMPKYDKIWRLFRAEIIILVVAGMAVVYVAGAQTTLYYADDAVKVERDVATAKYEALSLKTGWTVEFNDGSYTLKRR